MKPLSKSDRQAIIILIGVILACFITFPFVDRWVGVFVGKEKTDSLSLRDKGNNRNTSLYYAVEEKEGELFPFDPNTADSTQFLRLGLQPWQVRNIYKYRAAGGRYRKPTDFARLYGLTLKQYERLAPYIKIEKEVMAADVYGKAEDHQYHDASGINRRDTISSSVKSSASHTSSYNRASGLYPKKIKAGEKIDISIADTTALKTIPGIGPYFARQIVSYRERLGGYADVSQLLEIEHFPASSLSYMLIGNRSLVKQMKINQLDAWKLSRHPYILYVQAKEIVDYRQRKGSITSPSQLETLKTFTPSDIKRILPYLDFSR